eukprot:scaffold37477_cov80-Skeletonema_marinoi.AAC.4
MKFEGEFTCVGIGIIPLQARSARSKSCGDGQSNGTGTAEDSCLIPTDTVFDCVQYCRRLRQHWRLD